MTVYIQDKGGYAFEFPLQEQLDKLTACVTEELSCPYEVEVSVLLVGKEEIRRLNREFRDTDRPTDVLSFPMMEYDGAADFEGRAFRQSLTVSPETGELILGDIVICSEIVCAQAEEYGHSKLREFSFLTVHSLLHLFGYDHMEEEERIRMEEQQEKIMRKLGIGR